MDKFITLTTLDNNTIHLRKEAIGGFEEIPGTSRTEASLKVFISGYHFNVALSVEEFLELLKD